MPAVFAPRGANTFSKHDDPIFEDENSVYSDPPVLTTVNDDLPTPAMLAACDNLLVYDSTGRGIPFGSLYKDPQGKSANNFKVMIIFVRHFYCGLCQQFLRHLSTHLPTSHLSQMNPPTRLLIIGCGAPDLITEYSQTCSCSYPIYADPSRKVYEALCLTNTLEMGSKPKYQEETTMNTIVSSFFGVLGGVKGGKSFRGGKYDQVGGEFFFEGGEVRWCHRMENTRDHSEVDVLKAVMGVPE